MSKQVFHIIFDGQCGGNWWSVVNSEGHIVGGAQTLKEIRWSAGGAVFHKGINADHLPNLDTAKYNVSWDFYEDTIRWFESDREKFR